MTHTTAALKPSPSIASRAVHCVLTLVLLLATGSVSARTLMWGAPTNFADSARLQVKLVTLKALSVDVREWATTTDGEWVVVPARGPIVYSQNFPGNRALINLYHSLGQIDALAFTPSGDLAIVAGPLTYLAPGVPDRGELSERINELRSANGRINELAFTRYGDGWVVTAASLGYTRNVSADLEAAIHDALWSDRSVSNVTIGSSNRWAVVADHWFASNNLSTDMLGNLHGLLRDGEEISHLMIGPVGSYLLYSHGSFEPDREVEELEMVIGGENIYQRMDDLNIAGISLALIENNQVHMARGYGTLDADDPEQWVRTDSPFALASLSKYLTSLTAMTLVDDGLLSLDSDVYDFATQNPGGDLHGWMQHHESVVGRVAPGLTLGRLLSHTAGVAESEINRFNLDGWTSRTPTLLDLLTGTTGDSYEADRVRLAHGPGFEFLVSNPGFLLAEGLAQQATGQDFAELLRQRLFGPLGMETATIADPSQPDWTAWSRRAAVWHDRDGDPYVDRRDIIADRAAGGIYASAADYARAMIVVMRGGVDEHGNRLIPASLANEILADQADGFATDYGFGVYLGSGGEFFHDGWLDSAATTWMNAYPDANRGIVVLVNGAGSGEIYDFVQEIVERYEEVYNL